MSNQLKVLSDHRQAILLAEIGALIHNLGKLSEEFIYVFREGGDPSRPDFDYQHIAGILPRHVVDKSKVENWFRDRFSRVEASTAQSKTINFLPQRVKDFLWAVKINLPAPLNDREYCLGDFIDFQDRLWYYNKKRKKSRSPSFFQNGARALRLFERSHDAASGAEKEIGLEVEQEAESKTENEKDDDAKKEEAIHINADKQPFEETYLSTVFGYERKIDLSGLKKRRESFLEVLITNYCDRRRLLTGTEATLVEGLGDTRRPINDVTLWDISISAAAFFKAAIAKAILKEGGWTDPLKLLDDEWDYASNPPKWRLLALRFNGFDFLLSAHRVSDLMARRDLLMEVIDAVKKVTEVELPLANEVYRDEAGIVLLAPDVSNLLDREIGTQPLSNYLIERFNTAGDAPLDGEINFIPELSDAASGEKIRIGDVLGKPIQPLTARPSAVAGWWTGSQNDEVCTVCGLRPIAYGVNCVYKPEQVEYHQRAAKDRKVCGYCLKRREGRSQQWAMNLGATTIWIDEVADTNARGALLVGQFDLDDWLNGKLVRTLAVGLDDSNKPQPKNPSFARIRRVWETTRNFWQEVLPTDEDRDIKQSEVGKLIGKIGPRLSIRAAITDDLRKRLGAYHAYELNLGQTRLSVVWDRNRKQFISADNLVYVALQLGWEMPKQKEQEQVKEYWLRRYREAANELVRQMKRMPSIVLEEPPGYGGMNRELGTLEGIKLESLQESVYTPVVPILSEPRTFMALFPGDLTLDVVDLIRQKYEREMSKVYNRLPLHIGVVYFPRRTPLRAVLEAGKRMLELPEASITKEDWQVAEEPKTGTKDKAASYLRESAHFERWHEVILQNGDRKVTLHVSTVMGDGKTQDKWYPYFWVKTPADSHPIEERKRAMEHDNSAEWIPILQSDSADSKEKWVHVEALAQGDRVQFTPSTFDFEWLDTAGRRFEVAYSNQGQRYVRSLRPYLLDDVETIRRAWGRLAGDTERGLEGLSANQIHTLRDRIRSKREAWKAGSGDEAFRNFCRQVLLRAGWKDDEHPAKGSKIDPPDIDQLVEWAVSGFLEDVIELYLGIMKQQLESQPEQTLQEVSP